MKRAKPPKDPSRITRALLGGVAAIIINLIVEWLRTPLYLVIYFTIALIVLLISVPLSQRGSKYGYAGGLAVGITFLFNALAGIGLVGTYYQEKTLWPLVRPFLFGGMGVLLIQTLQEQIFAGEEEKEE